MSFIKKNLAESLSRVVFLVYAIIVPISVLYADGHNVTCNPADGKICNPINANTIQEFIKVLLEGVLKVGIPVVALAVIYCGFLFVSARGNSEKLTKAKDALLYTLIGAAILLGSWAIAKLISATVTGLGL